MKRSSTVEERETHSEWLETLDLSPAPLFASRHHDLHPHSLRKHPSRKTSFSLQGLGCLFGSGNIQ